MAFPPTVAPHLFIFFKSWLLSDLAFILPKSLIFHAVRLQHLEAISSLARKDVTNTMRCNFYFCYLTSAFFKTSKLKPFKRYMGISGVF